MLCVLPNLIFFPDLRVSEMKAGNNGPSATAIVVVSHAENSSHEALFELALKFESDIKQDHSDQSSGLADVQRGAQQGQDQTGIDGMADPAIGSGSNQFVPDLDGDRAAPVPGEIGPGPHRESESGDGEGDASDLNAVYYS